MGGQRGDEAERVVGAARVEVCGKERRVGGAEARGVAQGGERGVAGGARDCHERREEVDEGRALGLQARHRHAHGLHAVDGYGVAPEAHDADKAARGEGERVGGVATGSIAATLSCARV